MTKEEKEDMKGHFDPDQLNINPNTASQKDKNKGGRRL